jgi:DNA-binding response OmpR family regulator
MGQLVLIAEDQQHMRKLIEYKLTAGGYEIISAENGRQALDQARELLPSIILLDVMMPILNGFEVLSALKKDPRTREIPVLFVTAKTSPEEVQKALDMGASGYVTKPLNPSALLERVKEILAHADRA